MKQKRLLRPEFALLFIAIVVGVAMGTEVSQGVEKEDASGARKGVTKPAENSSVKPVEKTGTKPSVDSGESTPPNPRVAVIRSADEEAIRMTGKTYVKEFGNADARAVAALFMPDAEYVDEQGNVYQGRQEIENAMKAGFTTHPGGQIELNIDSIRFVSPDMAIEDGMTRLTFAGGDTEAIVSQYSAIHRKIDGKWLTASVREHSPKDRRQHRAQLRQLAWLQGDWVDEGDDSVVAFSCSAVDGGNFLLRKFTIRIAGTEAMSGTQRIGWDPLMGKLKSWDFDSEGGYSDGFWYRDRDRWMLKSTGVTADGQTSSRTTIYTPVNERTMTWQSVDHEIAGVKLPDSEPVTMVRRAPLPDPAGDSSN